MGLLVSWDSLTHLWSGVGDTGRLSHYVWVSPAVGGSSMISARTIEPCCVCELIFSQPGRGFFPRCWQYSKRVWKWGGPSIYRLGTGSLRNVLLAKPSPAQIQEMGKQTQPPSDGGCKVTVQRAWRIEEFKHMSHWLIGYYLELISFCIHILYFTHLRLL